MADPRSKELNMLDGPILPRILQFMLPLAATGMLQLLFNAADVIVVGKFSGSIALAAVGATSTLVNLIVNTFIGISVGVNILVARRIGCHDADGVSRASHCAVALSALLGLLVMAIGLLFSRPMLEWMETPADILEKSTLYLKLYFLGVPFTLIYNFGAAILRAYGDTRRPLIYLTVSGVEDVDRFDETEIVMNTSLGVLVVTGDSLHIGKLSLDGGELHVDGRIDAIAFEDAPSSRGGLLSRLFGG